MVSGLVCLMYEKHYVLKSATKYFYYYISGKTFSLSEMNLLTWEVCCDQRGFDRFYIVYSE